MRRALRQVECCLHGPTRQRWSARWSSSAAGEERTNESSWGKVFVLERQPPPKRRKVLLSPPPSTLPPSSLDIMSRQLLQFKPVEPVDTSAAEIDRMKPPMQRVSRKRFQQLNERLARAFTKGQVMVYCKDNHVKGCSNNSKLTLLDRVLREVWALVIAEEIKEEEDVLVTNTIQSRNRDLFFLLGDGGRILQQWSQSCSAKIVVDPNANTLVIESSELNWRRFERRLGQLLGKIVEKTVSLSSFQSDRFNESTMSLVARVSGSYIEFVDEVNIRISILGPKNNKIEDAQRLLLDASQLSSRNTSHLLQSTIYRVPNFLVRSSEDDVLPWYERGVKWARWRAPSQRQRLTPGFGDDHVGARDTGDYLLRDTSYKEVGASAAYILGRDGKRYLDQLYNLRSVIDARLNSQDLAAKVAYYATLGHVLHDNTRGHGKVDVPFLDSVAEQRRSIFYTNVPYISKVVQNLATPGPTQLGIDHKHQWFFRARFAPSPWLQRNVALDDPIVTLDLHLDQRGEIYDPALVAIDKSCSVHVMLPQLRNDLSFTGISITTLPAEDQAGVVDFMRRAQLNPNLYDKLRTPQTVELNIGGRRVMYALSRLTYHRVMGFKWRDMQITHSHIEGASDVGRTIEVNISCPDETGVNSATWTGFVDAANRVVKMAK